MRTSLRLACVAPQTRRKCTPAGTPSSILTRTHCTTSEQLSLTSGRDHNSIRSNGFLFLLHNLCRSIRIFESASFRKAILIQAEKPQWLWCPNATSTGGTTGTHRWCRTVRGAGGTRTTIGCGQRRPAASRRWPSRRTIRCRRRGGRASRAGNGGRNGT